MLGRVDAMDAAIDEDVAYFNRSAGIAMVVGMVVGSDPSTATQYYPSPDLVQYNVDPTRW